MKKFFFGILMLMCIFSVFAEKNNCKSEINGYKVVKKSVFSFDVSKESACFFAFYTTNPDPEVDVKGNGNTGNALWYGYYKTSKPANVYEFPKPLDTTWSLVCTLNAVSFSSMYGDNKRDVTVIGSCDRNTIKSQIPKNVGTRTSPCSKIILCFLVNSAGII